MRFYFAVAAIFASTALWATQASAQSAFQDITITATVPNACTINNVSGDSGVASTAAITINTNGSVNTAAVTPTAIAGLSVACNANATIQLSSLTGGVSLGGATLAQSAAGFQQVIDYQASATWNGVTASINTATTTGALAVETGTAANTTGANAGTLTVSVTPTANALPLAAGNYSDTLRVTFTPQ